MSDVRQAALLLLAADSVLSGDHLLAAHALDWAEQLAEDAATGGHAGDCTGHNFTCSACLLDQALAAAELVLLSDDDIPSLLHTLVNEVREMEHLRGRLEEFRAALDALYTEVQLGQAVGLELASHAPAIRAHELLTSIGT